LLRCYRCNFVAKQLWIIYIIIMNNNDTPRTNFIFVKAVLFSALIMLCILSSTVFALSADTLSVRPSRPTDVDSVIFTIRTFDHCSSTQYYHKNCTVNDSEIILFAEYEDKECRKSLSPIAPSIYSIASGPINAGTYKVYKTEDLYCKPGSICPAIAVNGEKTFLGEVTIKPVSGFEKKISERSEAAGRRKSLVTYSSARKEITFRLDKAQNVTVTAYIVNGEKSSELSSKKYLPAGAHSFHMDRQRFPSGIVVIHVKGENFSDVQMINLTK